jgi:hypothetical protein
VRRYHARSGWQPLLQPSTLFTAASNLFSVVTSVLCSDFRSLQRLLFSATTPVIYGDFCSQTDNLYYSHKSTLFSAGNLFFAALWRTTRTAADNFSLHPCGVLRAQRLTIFLGGPAADYARMYVLQPRGTTRLRAVVSGIYQFIFGHLNINVTETIYQVYSPEAT